MTGFLLDTNVPSELTRPKSDPVVEQWLEDANDDELYLSAVSLGEILKGITVLPLSKRRNELQRWLDETLRPWFKGRVLPVDELVAERWGIGLCRDATRAPETGRSWQGRFMAPFKHARRPFRCSFSLPLPWRIGSIRRLHPEGILSSPVPVPVRSKVLCCRGDA